ncbi:MAG: site-specific DNA-methyltransferase [Phycisphaerales bacterium]|nr:site-specific DNA-methyltransferase [Phycisphaerales bacterium]
MKKLIPEDPETKSADNVAENIAQLKILFPEIITEGKIDFDVLKQLLGGEADAREEKYGLTWHGKRKARQLTLTPSLGALRPCPEESVDWDTTQNLMIEGDNLEVLKLLQKSYAGKVQMIYIDPPYNTGKDFIYSDDYKDGIKNYLMLTGQLTSDGRKLVSNPDSSGRFHTDWLNMLYPRLKVARSLLRPEGLLFVSIDDHEADNLRKICVEIFGEENFVAQFVWNTEGHTDNQFDAKVNHEYILVFAKDAQAASLGHVVDPNTRQESNLWKGYAENSITKNGHGNPPSEILLPAGFPCSIDKLDLPATEVAATFFKEVKEHGYISRELTETYRVEYPVRLDRMVVANGRLTKPCRVFSGWANANKLKAFNDSGCQPVSDSGGDKLSFYLSDKGVIYYRRDRERARNILTVLRGLGTTEKMRSELETMGIPFQYPKPKELLQYLVRVGCEQGGIVMDFFAGSGTIAHSTWLQYMEDRVDRRLILVQLPELLSPEDDRQKNAVRFCDQLKRPRNIAELTKERLRRTAAAVRRDNPLFQGDVGFRAFKLDSSNIQAWEPNHDNLPETLMQHMEHLKTDRSEQDILFELLLKLGLDLTEPIERKVIAGKTVHGIGTGTLIVCLAEKITAEEVEPLAMGIVRWHQERAPDGETIVVFRDSAFADDLAKTNLAAILQQHNLENVRSI